MASADYAISPVTAQIALGILLLIYFINVPLYFWRRDKFPIKQRLPKFVTFELTLTLVIGAHNLAIVAFPGVPLITNCLANMVTDTLLINISLLMISFRLTWIFLKDFNTKHLVKNSKKFSKFGMPKDASTSSSTGYAPTEATSCVFIFVEWFVSVCLFYLNIYETILVILFPPLVLALADVIYVAAQFDHIVQTSIFNIDCYDFAFRVSLMMKVGLVGSLVIIVVLATGYILRIKDRMKIGREVMALTVPIGFFIAVLGIGLDRQVYQQVLIETRVWPFVDGAILIPLVIFVQATFPLYLSYKQERRELQQIRAKDMLEATQTFNLMNPNKPENTADLKQRLTKDLKEKRARRHRIANNVLEFHRLITKEDGRALFLQFLEREFAVENLLFYEICVLYREKCASGISDAVEEAAHDALSIYETFIDPSSPSAVNISGEQRQLIMNVFRKSSRRNTRRTRIFSEKGKSGRPSTGASAHESERSKPSPDLFEKAKFEIMEVLTSDSFRRFKLTKAYTAWVEDLSENCSYFEAEGDKLSVSRGISVASLLQAQMTLADKKEKEANAVIEMISPTPAQPTISRTNTI